MTPTWRRLARLLTLVVVTSLAGTLLGPVIKGGFGYTWGYLGGILGPLSGLSLTALYLVWWYRDPRYDGFYESEPAEDTGLPGSTSGRPAERHHRRSGRTRDLSLRRGPGSHPRTPRRAERQR